MVRHWTPKPTIISCIRSSPTGGNNTIMPFLPILYKLWKTRMSHHTELGCGVGQRIHFCCRPQRSCGKVMFSQASLILFTGERGRHPPGQVPPGGDNPLVDPPDRHCPRQTPPWADTSPGRHPQGRHPPGRHPPPVRCPRQADSPRRRLLQRAVRILLECITVLWIFTPSYCPYCIICLIPQKYVYSNRRSEVY